MSLNDLRQRAQKAREDTSPTNSALELR